MPWWSQPVTDEDPPAEHVHFPAVRRLGCWTCSCAAVYEALLEAEKRGDAGVTRKAPHLVADLSVVLAILEGLEE